SRRTAEVARPGHRGEFAPTAVPRHCTIGGKVMSKHPRNKSQEYNNSHTEAEARELWCPMVRFVSDNSPDEGSANRWTNNDNPGRCRCIASECAFWRWANISGPERGFCGLGGR